MPSDNIWLIRLKLELAYFSGRAFWQGRDTGGAGAILRFQRVRPRRPQRFQPLKSGEITPRFLDRTIRALKRWNYDIVGIDEACHRAVILEQPQRFACLTFDGVDKEFLTSAYPVLARHQVPFTLYVPTAFPDGLGEAWWLALETVIARENRISLMIDRQERHFAIAATADKYELYAFLSGWMRALAPPELTAAVNDLCRRYSVDLAALSRAAFMDWADLARLGADPRATFGCATVNYPVLSKLKDAAALREMTMGRAVTETALHRKVGHFAYPFGDRDSFRRAHEVMTEQAGFVSAATAIGGIVETAGRTNLRALPRIDWDGRMGSLRAMRVLLSGSPFAPVHPTRRQGDGAGADAGQG